MRLRSWPGDIHVEVIGSLEELDAFAPFWEQVYAKVPTASPYFCYDAVRLVHLHARREQQLRVCVVRDAEGPVAILPLVRVNDGPMGYPVLRVAGSGLAPRFEPVVLARARRLPILEAALLQIRETERWFSCQLRAVPGGSPFVPGESSAGRGSLRARIEPLGRSTVVVLPGTWEAYCKTLSRGFASEVRHDLRALERERHLRMVRLGLEPITASSELDRLMEDALAVSRASWQGTAQWGTAISDPGAADFFRAFCRRMAARGRLDLSVLYADEQPISFIWGAARWPRSSVAKCGFDTALKKKAPGMVHHALHFQDSIARGFQEIELGHEFTAQKARWSRRADELWKGWWYPGGLPALAYWGRRGVQATRGLVQRVRNRTSVLPSPAGS